MKTVILAAGMGLRLKDNTKNIPKCLLGAGEKTLLEISLKKLAEAGINEVMIVVGYKSEIIKEKIGLNFCGMKIHYLENPDYLTTNNMFSLSKIKDFVEGDTLILESDLLYEKDAVESIIKHPADVTLVSPVSASDDEGYVFFDEKKILKDITLDSGKKNISNGELVGITKLSEKFMKELFRTAESEYSKGNKKQPYYEAILKTSKIIPVKCLYKDITWIGINHEQDLIHARSKMLKKIEEREKS